jgi:hypothetical protein
MGTCSRFLSLFAHSTSPLRKLVETTQAKKRACSIGHLIFQGLGGPQQLRGEKPICSLSHQGMSDVTTGRIKQQLPEQFGEPALPDHDGGKILSIPFLGGLHHDDRRSA